MPIHYDLRHHNLYDGAYGALARTETQQEEKRRVKVQALDLALRHGTWMCRRCGGDNFKSRIKCYKCSTIRTRPRGGEESESSIIYIFF